MVASLVKLQANAVTDETAKRALAETQARIYAVGLIHTRLYSSGDVRSVALDEYLSGLLDHLETSMRTEGHGASLVYQLEPIRLPMNRSLAASNCAAFPPSIWYIGMFWFIAETTQSR